MPSEPSKLVFVGLMAVGKTTVGRLVAEHLGRPLSDSDVEIERQQGVTAKEIVASKGADALHELEAAHLLDGLAAPGPSVICAAASVVDVAACRTAMVRRGVFVAWLSAPPAALAERFWADPHRPTYDSDTERMLADQLSRREAHLSEVATTIIDTAGRTPDEIAADIARFLELTRLPD